MGADMIVAAVAVKIGTSPNFQAGIEFVRNLDITKELVDELESYTVAPDEAFNEDDGEVNPEKFRAYLVDLINELCNALDSRNFTTLYVRDLEIILTGGVSWGDAPEGAEFVWALGSIPGLFGVMGFELDWSEAARSVSPAEEREAIKSIEQVARKNL